MFKLLGVCLEVMFERIGHGIAILLMYRTGIEFTDSGLLRGRGSVAGFTWLLPGL